MATIDSLGRRINRPVRPTAPPDPGPAAALGEALAARRRAGQPWDDGFFDEAVHAVTRDLHPSAREDWVTILAGHRHRVWQPAYERRLPGGALTPWDGPERVLDAHSGPVPSADAISEPQLVRPRRAKIIWRARPVRTGG